MLVTEEELLLATGYKRSMDLEKHLRRQGIRFYRGRAGRVWTTTELIAKAGEKVNHESVEFEQD